VQQVREKLAQIRGNTELPVGVGFGIRDAESAARIAEFADAVVVGSALVNRIAALVDQPEQIPVQAPELIAEMRSAMDEVASRH
jgi:tryptophan synthase alpha chain